MINFLNKICLKNRGRFFFVKIPPPPPLQVRAVYEIIWKNRVESDWPQTTM